MAMGLARVTNAQAMDSGEKRLAELGYKQELKRDLSYVNAHIASIYTYMSLVRLITSKWTLTIIYDSSLWMDIAADWFPTSHSRSPSSPSSQACRRCSTRG